MFWHCPTEFLVSLVRKSGKERFVTSELMQVGEPWEAIHLSHQGFSRVLTLYQSVIYLSKVLRGQEITTQVHEHIRHTQRGSLKICGKTAKDISKRIKNFKKSSLQVMLKMIYKWSLSVVTSSLFQSEFSWQSPLLGLPTWKLSCPTLHLAHWRLPTYWASGSWCSHPQ